MKRMKRSVPGFVSLLIVLTLLLSGCAGGKPSSSPSDTATPSDVVDYNQYLNSPGYYACTSRGWYLCADDRMDYLDGGLESPVIPPLRQGGLQPQRPFHLQCLPAPGELCDLWLE